MGTQIKEFDTTFQETKDDIVFTDKDNNISEFKHFKNMKIEGNTTLDTVSIKIVILSPADEERKDKEIDVKDMLRYHNSSIYFANPYLATS